MKTVNVFSQNRSRDLLQVDRALQGDQQAYRTLFKHYWRPILFVVHKMLHDKAEVQDVTIEVFAKAFNNLHRFNREYCFSTWLTRIARNYSLDHLKKRRLPTTPLSTLVTDDTCDFFARGNDQDWQNKNPEEQFIQWQQVHTLDQHLNTLSPKYRDVARMRFWEAYSYAEIAHLLDLPLGTVKACIYRARLVLQQSLRPRRN